ncbi:MAG: hypothetical protein R3F61_32195 [Myxococcota bacterium]
MTKWALESRAGMLDGRALRDGPVEVQMWPFSERSIPKRIARAKKLIEVRDYLGAREEVGGVEDPEAAEVFATATRLQIERLLVEIAAQRTVGDPSRVREFEDIARRLGATDAQLQGVGGTARGKASGRLRA